ncbi:MAG TPA: (d)CMP kinase [Candidatus Baltobacteraceae bacterium]
MKALLGLVPSAKYSESGITYRALRCRRQTSARERICAFLATLRRAGKFQVVGRTARTQPLGMGTFTHIAIDGPVGSGKTTVARELAARLGILYLDTGAMYRAVALCALTAGVDPADEKAVLACVRLQPVHVTLDAAAPLGFRIYAGEHEFGEELYGNDVSPVASIVAAHPGVRSELVQRQRAIAAEGPVVMAGRDIGTVVLPDAPLKIFLTATVDARVERRLAELLAQGVRVDAPTLREQIIERDGLDASRPVSPLCAADDAIEIDSSDLSVGEVVERIASLAPSPSQRR